MGAFGERRERVLRRAPGADALHDPAPGIDHQRAPRPARASRVGHGAGRDGRDGVDTQRLAAQKTLIGEDRKRQAEALHRRRVDRDRIGADRKHQRLEPVELTVKLRQTREFPGGAGSFH